MGLTMLACVSAWAADFHALDVKPGQWETTMIGQMTGLPAIPPEVLKQMTPEQRAKMQAVMGGRDAKPIVSQSCMTKEKMKEAFNMSQDALKSCTTSLTTSLSNKQEIHVECNRDNSKSSGVIKIDAVDSEHIRGSMQMTATTASDGGHTMNMNYTFTSKWIGAACTEKQ
jgi:hypothetical protein